MVQKQPEGFHTLTPYLSVKDAGKAVKFYQEVFRATEKHRMEGPDGKLYHVQLDIGDSSIMLGEACPEQEEKGMKATTNATYVYVEDPDAIFRKATEKGAEAIMEPENMFYGDRTACFMDPFGQIWTVAVHKEDLSDDEIYKRGEKFFGKQAA